MPRLPRALALIAAVILVLSSGAYELFTVGCFAMLGWDPFLLTFFVPGSLLSIAAALMRRPATLVPA
jgi:hypothetical protein